MARRRNRALDEVRGAEDGGSQRPALPPGTGSNTVTVHLPMTFARRSGRKRMLAPDGKPVTPAPKLPAPADTPVIRALARAFRWRRMLEAGEYATVREMAGAESVNASYVSRVLRLTLLAPRIVEKLIEGRVAEGGLTVEVLLEPLPLGWQAQMQAFSKVAA